MSEIKPALTPEQWERREASFFGINMRLEEDGVGFGVADCETIFDDEERHALAALCLHEQPFGFTRDDVDELWSAIANGWDGLKSLADRIEALLPPGEQKP